MSDAKEYSKLTGSGGQSSRRSDIESGSAAVGGRSDDDGVQVGDEPICTRRCKAITAVGFVAIAAIAALIVTQLWLPSNSDTHSTRVYVVINATIWTGDTTNPWASAMAVDGVHIGHVGNEADVRKWADNEVDSYKVPTALFSH
jgi:hypothetical protein